MKARPILPFFVVLAAGFVGIFLFLQNVERGASNTASSVANITSPRSGATSVESPPRVVEHISAITARNPATVQPKSVQQTHEEPTLKELVVHRAHVEVGRIEGLVLVGNGPASATPVHVWEEGGEVSSDGELSAPSSTWSTTTMSDGSFAFEGFPAGRYRLQIEWGESKKEVPFEMKEGIGSKRVVCVFGSGTINGRVLNARGEPLIGALVSASELGPWIGGEGRIAQARTGGDGRYVLDGLIAGRYWLTARHAELSGGILDDHPQVRLNAGAHFELDLGNAFSGVWKGAVQDERGEPVEGPRLILLREKRSGLERRFLTDAGGTFREPLSPGTYDVFVGFQNQVLLAVGVLRMQGSDLDFDLECPTRPVIFQPVCLDCSISGRQVAVQLAKDLTLVGTESGVVYMAEIPRASGELRFYGLPPGEYTLDAGESFGIDIGGGRVTLRADRPMPVRALTLYRK